METQGKRVNQADKGRNLITKGDILTFFILTWYRQCTNFKILKLLAVVFDNNTDTVKP